MAQKALHKLGGYRLGVGQRGYYVKFDEAGRERRIQLGIAATCQLSDAKQVFQTWVNQREAALSHTTAPRIGELAERFITDKAAKGYSSVRTDRDRWRALRETFAHLFPADLDKQHDIGDVSLNPCQIYARQRSQSDVRRATIVGELVFIRTVLNWAFKHEIIDAKQRVWVPRRAKPRNTVLTPAEAMRLIDSAQAFHLRLVFTIALYTAQRKGAIEDLRWEQVDMERGEIDFRYDAGANGRLDDDDILDLSYKKGRGHVAIHPSLYVVLVEAKAVAQTPYVVEWNGRAPVNTKKAVQRAVKRAGLTGRFIGLHALRHTFATMAADHGVDMRVIQKTLGHEDIKTTEQIYAKHTPQYTLEASNAIARAIESRETTRD